MTFLAAMAADLVKAFITWLAGLIGHEIDIYKKESDVAAQADKDQTQLENAKTDEDKTNAATAINHDTFGS